MRRVGTSIRLIAIGACLIAVPAAYGQEEEMDREDRVRECECRFEPGAFRALQDLGEWTHAFGRRARLGVVLDRDAGLEIERQGARVDRVVPDSPAERAGLQEGDVIIALNGEPLALDEDGDADGSPVRRLIERVREMDPGDTVELEYLRDGRSGTVTVELGRMGLPDLMAVPAPGRPMIRMHGMLDRLGDVHDRAGVLRFGGFLRGLDMAVMNDGLARYFGAERGVLVLDVPEEGDLGLQAGDVIRSIDGRAVERPSDVRRILRSYVPEEEISFEIIRDRDETTVTGRVPESWTAPGELRIERRQR